MPSDMEGRGIVPRPSTSHGMRLLTAHCMGTPLRSLLTRLVYDLGA